MDQNLIIPIPKLKTRKRNTQREQEATSLGLHPLLARILASRPEPDNISFEQRLAPKLSELNHPLSMIDMQKSSVRLAQAIMNQEIIGIETDHDCDGQTSHAVIYSALVEHFKVPAERVRSYIGHRLLEGYGLSAKVAQRILDDQPRPSLIITADNGSADEVRIAQLAAVGIDVIVTDHHQLPISGPPKSAFACINPTRDDCSYGDPYIAGCMVAWLLMAATRAELIQQNFLADTAPKMTELLDFVAVGTVADCVSMARSQNNRAVVKYGLSLINAGKRACWRAVKTLVKGNVSAEDLGFKVGPLLNSDGRLDSAFGSVSFLLAADDSEAQEWIGHLQEQNQQRKTIQNNVTKQGMVIASQQTQAGRFSLCVFLADGHAGVHGISASRLKDSFGRPTVFLAPKQGEADLITGSIRGIEGFHVGNAIQWLIKNNPQLLIAGGGHAGAGGVTLRRADLQLFTEQFEIAAQQQLSLEHLGPVIWTDGLIPAEWLNVEILPTIALIEPFGREFEAPVFELAGTLQNFRVIGDGTHARVEITYEQKAFAGVWFGFRANNSLPILFESGMSVQCAVMLKLNDFGGVKRCELQVVWMQEVNNI